ncbi:hypothetical protein [Sinosporangium siamense]|uniref:Uncharacterized protein n=1 Tax=Sinosporangium siamense TaxID=1367973 RepID=A0A919RL10_9ACTN|nr:hypothetical protein [Sinosporangium siamense]GII94349.1 hypothetical protein Ssi02_45800 [Sinosporangium siamense]
MKTAWQKVRAAIEDADTAALVELATGWDVDERRQIARELPGYLPAARAFHQRRHSGAALDGWITPMRVAGAGSIADAAAVAAWVNRREFADGAVFRWDGGEADDTEWVVRALATRPVEWRQDLAVRLALRLRSLRPEADRRVNLALTMLRESGAQPPEHAPLTAAWLEATGPADLAGDPLLDTMVRALFESEGVGRLLQDDLMWPKALCALAGAGRLSREGLLAGCRSRFLAGGVAVDQRFFVRLHDMLDPTPEETTPYVRDYLALLPSATPYVAGLALKAVRGAGTLPPAQAGEAVEALLYRPEGRFVRAGLTWLDRLLKHTDDGLDAWAPALSIALTNGSGQVRDRAARLAAAYAPRFSALGAAAMREALESSSEAPFVSPRLPDVPPMGGRMGAGAGRTAGGHGGRGAEAGQ